MEESQRQLTAIQEAQFAFEKMVEFRKAQTAQEQKLISETIQNQKDAQKEVSQSIDYYERGLVQTTEEVSSGVVPFAYLPVIADRFRFDTACSSLGYGCFYA